MKNNEACVLAEQIELLSEDSSNYKVSVNLLLSAVKRLQVVCGPYHYELYTTRCKLLTVYLVSGKTLLLSMIFLSFLRVVLSQCDVCFAHAPLHTPIHTLLLHTHCTHITTKGTAITPYQYGVWNRTLLLSLQEEEVDRIGGGLGG